MSGTLQVGGITLGTHNSGTGKVDITNAGATTITTLNTTSIASGTLGSSVVVPASLGASLVLLNTTTVSSAVASVSFDNTLITATYNAYRVVFTGVSSSADDFDMYCQFSNDNGSSRINVESVYDYKGINTSSEGTIAGQTDHRLWFDAEGINSDSSGAGYVDFILPPTTGTGVECFSFSSTAIENQNGTFYGYWTMGISLAGTTGSRVNHIKFLEDGGSNFDAGKFSLYGFKF